MNILSIENKFRALDSKEKEIRQFYNPKSSKGKKHHYIADIRADFQYDTLLYGLGMFWMQESESSSDEKIETHVSLPKTVPVQAVRKRSPIIAKRKNLALLDLQKSLVKEPYMGGFSNTKLLNKAYFFKASNLELGKPSWKAQIDKKSGVKNKAAKEEVIYSTRAVDKSKEVEEKIRKYRSDYPRPLPKENLKGLTAEEFKNYLITCKEILYYPKPQAKFNLDLENLRKEPQKLAEKNEKKLFKIMFDKNPIVGVKSLNEVSNVSFTDISSPGYPTQTFVGLVTENGQVRFPGTGLDLRTIFGSVEGHVVRVLVQGEKESFDYYISLRDYNSGLEEEIKNEIIQYKVSIYTQMKKKGDVNPLVLQNLQIGVKKTLPKIETKPKSISNTRKKLYSNPITTALFNYKKNTEAFHPMAYPSNLSIFEAHDFIEENYPAPARFKQEELNKTVDLEISGMGLNTSYIN